MLLICVQKYLPNYIDYISHQKNSLNLLNYYVSHPLIVAFVWTGATVIINHINMQTTVVFVENTLLNV